MHGGGTRPCSSEDARERGCRPTVESGHEPKAELEESKGDKKEEKKSAKADEKEKGEKEKDSSKSSTEDKGL